MQLYLMINDIFDRIIYEQIEDNKLMSLYLFNNNFQLLWQNIQFFDGSEDKIKLYKDSKLVKIINSVSLIQPQLFLDYQIDLNQNNTGYIRTKFKQDGIYVTLTEAKRFIDNKIELGEVRDQFQELSEAKTEDEYKRILSDCGTANYIK